MTLQAEALIPTKWGNFRMLAFSDHPTNWMPHLALVHEKTDLTGPVLTRIHSECITGDLFAVAGASESEAGLVSLAGRRVPIVAVCDGEAGLVDNIGSIVGVKQATLAVRKFSKCGRPDEVFAYQHLDADSIVEACGRVLAETALEDLRVSPALLERLAGRESAPRRDWRALWPDAPPHA